MIEHAKIVEGLEISTNALIQSINGLAKREDRLLESGQHMNAKTVRDTIEKLYMLRNGLVEILSEQKRITTD